jgi:rhamnose transport system permease protein
LAVSRQERRLTVGTDNSRSAVRVDASHLIVLAIALVGVVLGMSHLSAHFLSLKNLLNATRFMTEIGLLSLGMAVVVISGGIDLSVGSMMALSAIGFGLLIYAGAPLVFAAALTLALGAVAGGINGLVITTVGLPPIIVTLATLAVYRGIAMGVSGAKAFPISPDFAFLGQGALYGAPVQALLLAVVALVLAVTLRRSTFGRAIYAIGANEIAARFSGIDVKRVKLAAYALSGLLSAAAGLVFVSRVSSAKANVGTGYELDAITIVVLSGIPISGGRGSILGVVLGLVTVGLARNGMSLAFIQSDIQAIVIGGLLIAAVVVNRLIALIPIEFLFKGARRTPETARGKPAGTETLAASKEDGL